MVNLFIALEVFAICLTFVALVLLQTGDGSREQKLMVCFLCGSLAQNVGYLLEMTAANVDVALAAAKVQNMGSAFIPICYCWFIYAYCHEDPPARLLKILTAIDFAILPAIFFDQWGLFYRDVLWVESSYGHHYINMEYGPLYMVFLFSRILIPYVMSIFVLLRTAITHDDPDIHRQYKVFLGISLLPVLALTAYVLRVVRVFDLTPATLGLTLSLVVILVWGRRNYDVRHMAADVVLNSLGDGIIAVDEQHRLISYNPAAARIFPDLTSYQIGDELAELNGFQTEMLDENLTGEFSIGGRFYESHAKEIRDENGRTQGYVVLFVDTTETKRSIDEIKRLREQAEKASLAKSEFLSNMSHEIRTPMNAIIGLSDLILEECQGRKVYSFAKDVQTAAKSLLAIINDILDLSKVEAGKMTLVYSDYYIQNIVGDVLGMMKMAATQRGLSLECNYAQDIPCCYNGDEGRIRQILINLMNNAVKFTERGYVRISVEGWPGQNPGEELLCFQVEDTGCGIREEDQEKIFEEFRQVNSSRNRGVEGTGLGLAIVRHLVHLMNGSLALESEYGKGSTFTVTIPQRIVDARTLQQVPQPPEEKPEQIVTFKAPDFRVLIVDDNAVNRKVAKGFLKSYGFDLSEAESGQDSINQVRETKFDLIFMDHMMPMMDGIEAVQIIRRDCGENGTYPVIVALTANAMEGIRDKFLSNGFQDFIAKPLERKQLHMLLSKWVPPERRQQPGEEPPKPEGPAVDTAARSAPKPAQDAAVPQIPGIDTERAAQYYNEDAAEYIGLLELYCLEGKRKLDYLQELVEERDIPNYEVEVHGLKSASANIGAMALSQMARDQEAAAHVGDEVAVVQHFPALLAAYQEQLANIKAFLKQRRAADRAGGDALPEIAPEELVQKVGEALAFLEDFQSHDCAEIVEDLLAHQLAPDVAEELEEIQEQLRLYEDDTAEALLRQLHQQLS